VAGLPGTTPISSSVFRSPAIPELRFARLVILVASVSLGFGRIAVGLGQGQPETEFEVGLRKFSMLLVQVAAVLTSAIFIINVALHKPVITALLLSPAIAVGITPQLLPAVVSTSLAAGSRELARAKVLVKRLVCIEDLGDIDVLFTDKTGTLTEGSLRFMRSAGPDGTADEQPLLLGLLCNEAVAEDDHGNRVIAAATREIPGRSSITTADEHDLTFRGILVFLDPPKPPAKAAPQRLAGLGVAVKILTGDNPVVAAKVCADLGLPPGQVATGRRRHLPRRRRERLPYTGHLAHILGFRPLPGTFFFALVGIVVVYLVLVEIGKSPGSGLRSARSAPRSRCSG